MKRILQWLILAGAIGATAQNFTNAVLTPITMTGVATSPALPLSSSYATGTIQLVGTSLTTATFAIYGCNLTSCTSANYFALPMQSCGDTTGTFATTQTATANSCYRVNLAGMTSVEYVTSGTFTATNITLTLTGSPNAQIGRSSSGGTLTNPLTLNTTGGAAPGTTFNGSAAVTVSPGTIGYPNLGTLNNGVLATDASGNPKLVNAVHLGTYAHGSSWATCATVTWPHAGCTDETAAIQSAIDAAATTNGYLFVDPPPAGSCYYASQETLDNGVSMMGQGYYAFYGSAFCQIPGSNEDFFLLPGSTGTSTGYRHWMEIDGISFYGDQSFTSTTGRGLVFPERVGELTELHRITVDGFAQDGIATEYGSDPLLWTQIQAAGNGYGSGGGCGINLTKTSTDPFDSVDIRGISVDGNSTGGVCITGGTYYLTGDTIHLEAIKGESSSTSPQFPISLPDMIVLNNLNGTAVDIEGVSAVALNPSAPVSNAVASGCNGTTCTVVVNFSSGFVPPSNGQTMQLSGTSISGLNTTCVVTSTTTASATCTMTTAASSGTSTGGNLTWNRTADAVVKINTSNVQVKMGGFSVEGGTNSLGSWGFKNIVNDTVNSVTVPASTFGTTASGGTFNSAIYYGTDTLNFGANDNYVSTHTNSTVWKRVVTPGTPDDSVDFTGTEIGFGTGYSGLTYIGQGYNGTAYTLSSWSANNPFSGTLQPFSASTYYGTAYNLGSKYVARSQTAAISAQNLLSSAVPATSLYQISADVVCDSAVSAATVTMTVTWSDPSTTVQTQAVTAACTTLGTASYAQITQTINARTGTNITVATSIVGSPTYDVAATANQLTPN